MTSLKVVAEAGAIFCAGAGVVVGAVEEAGASWVVAAGVVEAGASWVMAGGVAEG